jgi:hypothetical protein
MSLLTFSALLLAAMVAIDSTPVRAEVSVHGDITAVRIDASQASVSQVLAAVGSAFNIRTRTSTSLDSPINGTYTGSLSEVMSRVLDGYNYVVKNQDGSIEITIFGRRGTQPVAAEPPPPPRNSATQWRTPGLVAPGRKP